MDRVSCTNLTLVSEKSSDFSPFDPNPILVFELLFNWRKDVSNLKKYRLLRILSKSIEMTNSRTFTPRQLSRVTWMDGIWFSDPENRAAFNQEVQLVHFKDFGNG